MERKWTLNGCDKSGSNGDYGLCCYSVKDPQFGSRCKDIEL